MKKLTTTQKEASMTTTEAQAKTTDEKTYVVEYKEEVIYRATVTASSKAEAIAKTKECEYDVNDLMHGSFPYAIKIVEVI
jgi:hypothetical protein